MPSVFQPSFLCINSSCGISEAPVNLFKLRGMPTTIVLNEKREEIARIMGVVDFSDKKFLDWLDNF